MKVVVGIPALNEEANIAKAIVRSQKYVDKVLVIDDGSHDDTALIAEKLGAVVLRHDRNLGKGAALRDCFEWARRNKVDVLVTLDADGQHDPAEIPNLVKELRRIAADVVIGSRLARPTDMPKRRWFGGRVLDRMTGVKVDGRYVDAQSGFRAYSKKATAALVAAEYGMGADAEVIMRANQAGMRIVEVPVTTSYAGKRIPPRNAFMHWLDVGFSVVKFTSVRHPMLVYGGFALIAFAVSLIFGLMTIDYYQRWGRVITNLALISVASGILGFLALFTAIILFALITVIRQKY